MHHAIVEQSLVFHGGVGEKSMLIGRPVVVSTERVLARIPSYFVHAENACPATTYYESAQARGVVRAIEDPDEKAQGLQSLMRRLQPEGGHAAVSANDARYRGVIESLSLFAVPLDELTAKRKLGQNRSEKQITRVVESLWRRGDAGDLEVIETILDSHPAKPRPAFLRGADGTRLVPAFAETDAPDVLELLRGQYWAVGDADETILGAQRGATAWVGARDDRTGKLVACARAITDGHKHAYVADVAVLPTRRRRGIARDVVRFLLDHPRMRNVQRIRLTTRDAQALYAELGFAAEHEGIPTTMLRQR
jgi:ribosomal protein S18 acetylase RimI-like enzyme/nitroimidazol reductase NimA-like FMN-containing flavoprotein (pyridoxamine 5'-phosphate oxidase superfamily)